MILPTNRVETILSMNRLLRQHLSEQRSVEPITDFSSFRRDKFNKLKRISLLSGKWSKLDKILVSKCIQKCFKVPIRSFLLNFQLQYFENFDRVLLEKSPILFEKTIFFPFLFGNFSYIDNFPKFWDKTSQK